MSANCQHEECDPYRRCQAATLEERRAAFWLRYRSEGRRYPEDMGTDPLGWLEGAVPD